MGKIVLSTTSELNGWNIEEYVDVISTQVVIGTGVFSDLFAGITDFTGGSSSTYEKQLKDITSRALEQLSNHADSLKANAIVGVRLDYDEISGKGKQMFMLTATGTAVVAKKINDKYVQLNRFLDEIIDEDLAYGKVGNLPLISIKIDKILKDLDEEDPIFLELKEQIFQYYRIVGKYAKAEDLLYSLLEEANYYDKKKLIDIGIEFYENILKKTDLELKNGNLPRSEVLESLNEIKEKYKV